MKTGNMSLLEKIAYACGGAGMNCLAAFAGSFLTYYFTDSAAISAAVAGNIIMISRVFDAFSDITMGTIVDNTSTKMGKARPWLLRMAIPGAISLILLFSVPDFSPMGKIIYVFIMYNLHTTIFATALNVPSVSLNALVTDDVKERGVISVLRMTFAQLTMLMINSYALKVVDAFGGGKSAWSLTALIFGLISVTLLFFTALGVKERLTVTKDKKNKDKETISFRQKASIILHNKNLLIVAGTTFASFLVVGLMAGNVYYAQYILGDRGLVSSLSMSKLLPSIIAMLILLKVTTKLSKKKTSLYGLYLALAGGIGMIIAPENYNVIIIGLVLQGIGTAPLSALQQAMVADSLKGDSEAGIGYGFNSLAMKMGSGLGASLTGWLLALGGYTAQASVQSAAAQIAIKAMIVYIPTLVVIVLILMLLKYDVKE